MVLKSPLKEETSQVRTLNRSVSEAVSSMHHVQTRPAQAQNQCGKPDASTMYVSDSMEDDTQYIQAVTLHPHQFNGLQKNAKSKESLLLNNYGKEAINHELSSALHLTGIKCKAK